MSTFRHKSASQKDQAILSFFMATAPTRPRQFTPQAALPNVAIVRHGDLFGISESDEHRDDLFDHFGIGYKSGPLLVLSPFEALFLLMLNPAVNIDLNVQELWNHCSMLFPPTVFARYYAVYHYYRCNLWVVRDGSVFGAHFVLYADHPDLVHSKFLVIVMDDWNNRDCEMLRASRIGWSVRKSALLVNVKVPSDADFGASACLSTFSIEDVTVKRVKFR
jgi:tRNA-intron lyase